MITQAEAEAMAVRAQNQTEMVAIAEAAAVQVVATSAPRRIKHLAAPGDIRVSYIPAPVREQIKEEIKLELATDRTIGKIANTFKLPAWVEKAKPAFDLRFRYAGTYFPSGNDAYRRVPELQRHQHRRPLRYHRQPVRPATQRQPEPQPIPPAHALRPRFRYGRKLHQRVPHRHRQQQHPSLDQPRHGHRQLGHPKPGRQLRQIRHLARPRLPPLRHRLPRGHRRHRLGRPLRQPVLLDPARLGRRPGLRRRRPHPQGGCHRNLPTLRDRWRAFVVYNTDFNFSSNQPEKFASY